MAIGGVKGGNLGSMVSGDNHILDGHHRWAATLLAEPKAKIGTEVDLGIGDLVLCFDPWVMPLETKDAVSLPVVM